MGDPLLLAPVPSTQDSVSVLAITITITMTVLSPEARHPGRTGQPSGHYTQPECWQIGGLKLNIILHRNKKPRVQSVSSAICGSL